MAASAVIGALRVTLGLDSASFSKGLGAAQKELNKASKQFKRNGEDLKDIGKSMSLAITAPLAAAGIAGIKMAGDFEGAMNRVKINSGAAGKELKSLNELALDLGHGSLFGATEIANAMDDLAKSGLNYETILGGAAKAAVTLATATDSELGPATIAISDAMKQFDIPANKLSGTINQITGAVNLSKLDFADYQQAMGAAGGVAGALGVSFVDFNAVLAGTSQLFASGSDAGTSFKTFLTSLVPQSKDAAGLMQQYGLAFFDASGKMKPMSAIAEILRTKLGGLNDEAKTEVLKKIFGVDAMRTAIGLMDQGAAGLDKIKEAMRKIDAEKQAQERLKGFYAQLEILKGSLETLAIRVAQSGVLEAITSVVAGISGFIDTLSQASPETLKFVAVVATIGAALGPVIFVVGNFVTAFGAILPVLRRIGPALTALRALWVGLSLVLSGTVLPALGAVFAALSPILIPLAAVAAAVTAGYLVWKNWDAIGPIIARMYEAVKGYLIDKLGKVFAVVAEKIEMVKKAFFYLYDAVVGNSYVPDMVDGISAEFGRLEAVMVKPSQKMTKAAADSFKAMTEASLATLARLFPEVTKLRELQGELNNLDATRLAGKIDEGVWVEARRRIIEEIFKTREAAEAAWADGPIIIDTDDLAKKAEASIDQMIRAADEVGKSFDRNIGDQSESAAERASRAFADLAQDIQGIFGSFKKGGLSGILDGIVGLFGVASKFGAFGGGGEGGDAVPGFASGGSFRVGGAPGIDRNLVQFRATKDEIVDIRTPGQARGGGEVTKIYDLRGAMLANAFVADVERMVAAGEARAIRGGAQLAMQQNKFISDRRLG